MSAHLVLDDLKNIGIGIHANKKRAKLSPQQAVEACRVVFHVF
jgi:hypothetical protein